jgi:esterase/lipase superfamily enzyme
MVDILFATNRVLVSGDPLSPFGEGDVAPGDALYCGLAAVDSIDIGASSSGRITRIDDLVQGNFEQQQHLARIYSSPNDILVFVHGAANNFTDSITRAAYNQTWLAASGLPNSTFDVIAFSWPATSYTLANIPGDYADYKSDQQAAKGSAAQFGAFLNQMAALRAAVDQLGTKRINLLCHSMGNFMLADAVRTFLAMSNTPNVVFDEVILAAADETATTFSAQAGDRLSQLFKVGREVTVYFSRADIAMDLSQAVNKDHRLGYDGPPNKSDTQFFSTAIYEFVDCTTIRDFISSDIDRTHQYYRQSPTVRSDIVQSLAGLTPTRPRYDPATNVYFLV